MLARLALPLAVLAALVPARADACGGFFCDSVNGAPVPVDQTGENILFVVDRDAGLVEAHIQIQYTGDPQKFAWVIPVTAVPDFSVGSEALFTNLLGSTVPTYGFTAVRDCADDDRNSSPCAAVDAASDSGSGSTNATGPGESSDGGPEVIKREIVGAFEIVVLQGGTAQEVTDWIDAFGYFQDPDAPPIIGEYLEEGFMFAAARLIQGAGVEEIQPLVMTYAGDTPCVPLRLTRIAATEDMGVRVFALADERTAPSNYRHVELNDVRLDWTANANNYAEVVAMAVDTPGADGQAFVTEYAGTTDVVSRANVFDPAWSAAAFAELPAVDVIDRLEQQNILDCHLEFASGCSFFHPRILPLLRTYLPAPADVDENTFWGCLDCYAQQIDMAAWDPAGFAADFQERIVDPGAHANALLDRWPYLTRMLTVMSPNEMTVDPEFLTNADLPDVAPGHTATMMVPCSGSNRMELPSERDVLTDDAGNWPDFAEAMPWAARVEQIAPAGAPQVLAEFDEAIDAALKTSNARFSYDDGRGLGCSVRPGSWLNLAAMVAVLGFAWHGRRRRRVTPSA